MTVLVCEGHEVGLVCRLGWRPVLVTVFWGRRDRVTCPHLRAGSSGACSSRHQAARVIAIGCSSVDHECYFPAVTDLLGDPCPGTYKYLKVTYACACKCVSKPISGRT